MVESLVSRACSPAFFGIGPMEMLIVGVIAVLLFGSRLPEVARSLGKSIVEFKRGIQGVESEINNAIYGTKPHISHYADVEHREEPAAAKSAAPADESSSAAASPDQKLDSGAGEVANREET
ncbi:MAG: hypothetical protein A2W31_09100 [Planctomycetes bacterium RBG_16_64_10]|nr:MAG: hypothetical protein A2W31_09100 [Planctomycetes bacterium RBG_16_64_10]